MDDFPKDPKIAGLPLCDSLIQGRKNNETD